MNYGNKENDDNPIMKKLVNLIILLLCAWHAYAQQSDLSWEELQKQYSFPEWYTNARFGIWATIGPQSVPRLGGSWYARHMFMEDVSEQQFGRNAYSYHQKHWGIQKK